MSCSLYSCSVLFFSAIHQSFLVPGLSMQVFNNFSLMIPAGKTVALVGSSGSGKSTAVQLIERFYDPDSGVVLLDGIDLRQLNLHWLRSNVSGAIVLGL